MKKLLTIAACAFLSFGLCSLAAAQPGPHPGGPGAVPAHHVAPPPPPRPAPRPDMGPDHHRPVPRDCRMCDDMRRRCHFDPRRCDMEFDRCMHECRPLPPPPPPAPHHMAPPPRPVPPPPPAPPMPPHHHH